MYIQKISSQQKTINRSSAVLTAGNNNREMDFSYTENQNMIAQMVRDFAEKEIRPKMMEWDESQEFPVALFKKLGELGLMGILVPAEYGGSGFGYNEYITVIDELSQVCGSIGLSVAAHNSLCTGHIMYFGNEEQKKEVFAKIGNR
jgi:alkylation response protein AidB-like acyl-CoA dehydrogenase